MSRKIIGNQEPRCEYCKNGKLSADGKMILCSKMGVLNKDFSCRKFKYDPLKRTPENRSVEFMKFSSEDFKL